MSGLPGARSSLNLLEDVVYTDNRAGGRYPTTAPHFGPRLAQWSAGCKSLHHQGVTSPQGDHCAKSEKLAQWSSPTAVLTHRLGADDQISANLELVFTTLPAGNSVVAASYQRLVNTWAWSSRTGKAEVRGILMEF